MLIGISELVVVIPSVRLTLSRLCEHRTGPRHQVTLFCSLIPRHGFLFAMLSQCAFLKTGAFSCLTRTTELFLCFRSRFDNLSLRSSYSYLLEHLISQWMIKKVSIFCGSERFSLASFIINTSAETAVQFPIPASSTWRLRGTHIL